MADVPQFRRAITGERKPFEAEVSESEILPAGRHLTARWVKLADSTWLRQHQPVRGRYRPQGYDRLDNEILAGRQLCDITDGRGCPPEVSQFYGDDDDTAVDDPFALFEPYRGAPLSDVGDNLIDEERTEFRASLLRGLCWLAAAGIAHRALNLETVWWDGQRAQITDFSLSTVFGVPRTPVPGAEAWVPKDLRESTFKGGPVGERDDIWAAGRLIFHVWNGGAPLRGPEDLAHGGLDELLRGVFGPPGTRPPASELLRRLGETSPAYSWSAKSMEWRRERELFLRERRRLHPGVSDPPDFYADLGNPGDPGDPAGTVPAPGRDHAAPPPPAPAAEVPDAGAGPATATESTESWPSTPDNDTPRRWSLRRRQGEK
jgi:serine/threonine protein kinase